jgi:hypothetical protein
VYSGNKRAGQAAVSIKQPQEMAKAQSLSTCDTVSLRSQNIKIFDFVPTFEKICFLKLFDLYCQEPNG